MKKFQFTLQTVHNVREMRQEKEEIVLSEMQAEINRAIADLAKIEKIRLDAIENYTLKMKRGEPMNPFEMELHTNHLRAIDQLIREVQLKIEEKKQACAHQSQIVAHAGREVKITERLRENQHARHRLEQERREQTALDELVSANFARQMLTNQ